MTKRTSESSIYPTVTTDFSFYFSSPACNHFLGPLSEDTDSTPAPQWVTQGERLPRVAVIATGTESIAKCSIAFLPIQLSFKSLSSLAPLGGRAVPFDPKGSSVAWAAPTSCADVALSVATFAAQCDGRHVGVDDHPRLFLLACSMFDLSLLALDRFLIHVGHVLRGCLGWALALKHPLFFPLTCDTLLVLR